MATCGRPSSPSSSTGSTRSSSSTRCRRTSWRTSSTCRCGRWRPGCADRRITLEVTDAAKAWLAEQGYDPAYGARPLRRLVQREIGDRLARALLSGEVRDGRRPGLRSTHPALTPPLRPARWLVCRPRAGRKGESLPLCPARWLVCRPPMPCCAACSPQTATSSHACAPLCPTRRWVATVVKRGYRLA
jgi:hypothetical protein